MRRVNNTARCAIAWKSYNACTALVTSNLFLFQYVITPTIDDSTENNCVQYITDRYIFQQVTTVPMLVLATYCEYWSNKFCKSN